MTHSTLDEKYMFYEYTRINNYTKKNSDFPSILSNFAVTHMLSTAHACGIFVIFLGHSLSGKKVLAIVLEFFHIIVLTISQVYRKTRNFAKY